MHFVVTATSRGKRPGEVDGKDYYFVTKEDFLTMIEREELLEYAIVYGEYKGIPKQQVCYQFDFPGQIFFFYFGVHINIDT